MAKKTKTEKPSVKTPKAKNNPPQTSEAVQTVENPSTEETQVTNAKDIKGKMLISRETSNLSADGQVKLLDLAARFFHDDPNAVSKYGEKVVDNMNRLTAVGIVVAMADQAANGNSAIGYAFRSEAAYKQLAAVAKDMGVTIPDVKQLPAPNQDGVIVLPSTEVKVEETVANELKDEKKIEEAGDKGDLELNPEKVAELGEEDLKNALKYILVTNFKRERGTKDALIEVVTFMQKYRMAEAKKAENSSEAMDKYASRTTREWLEDVFSYVKPVVHMQGVGKGLYATILGTKSPLPAFLILRDYLTNKGTGKVEWDDQSIADAVYCLVRYVCEDNIAKEEAAKAALDPKAKGYRDIATKHDEQIKINNDIIGCINDITFDVMDNFLHTDDNLLASARGRIRKQYYAEYEPEAYPSYKNLWQNVEQQAGIILNLFRMPGNKNQNYSEANLTPIERYTQEEYDAIVAEEREAKKAAKKAESKKD